MCYSASPILCSCLPFVISSRTSPSLPPSLSSPPPDSKRCELCRCAEIALATLRLAIPFTFVWLLMIGYGLFYFHLNLVAEITCFEDRQFFREVERPNAQTLSSDWDLVYLRHHVADALS